MIVNFYIDHYAHTTDSTDDTNNTSTDASDAVEDGPNVQVRYVIVISHTHIIIF
jgi:hypothetical protein